MDDIAIIGIGCRVPGADNIDEFWRVLVNSENHIVDVPKDRWNNDAFYSDNKDETGKTYVSKAGFINGHDEWDNKFFGVSDSEAVNVDPQHSLVLECTYMALEDAGITRKQIQGTQTGVYIGAMNEDYKNLLHLEHKDDTNYIATGTSSTIISARVSYVYDLRGPCMVVDTACSSSMIAMHLGCQAIKTGDCDMAICGGVNCLMSPSQFITLCKAKMLSPTGQCQSFCDTADGYGRGEGCGIVIVKSYEKAVRDKNNIWGIIKTASNQDGHATQPITAPSVEQQRELLKKLYTLHDIDPTSLQYIEAHGTGTSAGDPTEVNAIGGFIEANRSKPSGGEQTNSDSETYIAAVQTNKENKSDTDDIETKMEEKPKMKNDILIGSVKSNIGHLESAAGVAGVIKVLLMMKHGKYVPSLHVKKDKSNINKNMALDLYGLEISLEVREWKPNADGDRICCVNCFGFGGSNTHAIMLQRRHKFQRLERSSDNFTSNQYKIICITNISTISLGRKLQLFGEDLTKYDLALQDISFTSIFHRDHFTYRTFLFGKTTDEIQKQVQQKMEIVSKIQPKKKIRIIFVFCGVGTTWKGMCREMMDTHSVFRETVSRIDEELKPLTGWSISEKFQNDTDYSDPFLHHIAIFCTQVALFEQWKSWGIHPQTIVGQSVGEVAASFASGSLNLKDAIQVIFHRSKILSKITGGKMMVAENISIDRLEHLCGKLRRRVVIAVYNSPVSGTISGDADAIEQIKEDLEEMNKNTKSVIMTVPLSVQCAYHSNRMEQCTNEIESELKNIKKRKRITDHYSTVTGKLAENNDFQTGKYWADNIRKPVLFMDAILQSTDDTATNVFVEIGPRQVLRSHLKHILGENLNGICLPSMKAQKECQSIYSSLSKLFELGADISWEKVVSSEGQIVPIPRHVFQKTRALHIPKAKQLLLKGIQSRSDSHMFLRQSTDGKADFQLYLDKNTSPFVYDHYMYTDVLVPGATYIEAAFEIGHQKTSLTVLEISVSIEFVNTLMPKNEKQCIADVEVITKGPNDYQYQVRQNKKLLCQGKITPRIETRRQAFNVQRIQSRCKTYRTKEESYGCLDRLFFQYGESLRVIEQSWSSSDECVVEFRIPDVVLGQRKVTHIHPCVIDGLFQMAGVLGNTDSDGPALPKGVGSFSLNRPPQRNMFGYSQLVKSKPTRNHYNFFLLCPDGHVIAEVYDFYIEKVNCGSSDIVHNIRHCLIWQEISSSEGLGQNEQDSEKDGGLAVIASDRFLSFYKPFSKTSTHFFDTEKDGEIRQASSVLKKVRSVIFAPSYHIQSMKSDGTALFDCIKKSFSKLSALFDMLRQQSANIPVYVVTENVFGLQNSTNVCGAELWGMARSALNEGAASEVKLIDMPFLEENAAALQTILDYHTTDFSEYLIENGKIHHCEVKKVNDQDVPLRRKIGLELSENTILKSGSALAIVRPFFDMRLFDGPSKTSMSTHCKIRLKNICLHDSSIFLTSLSREDEKEWTEEATGYPMICIEGIGNRHDSVERGDVAFCFPTIVSTLVSIPVKCTCDLAELPVYIPGMFTVGVMLWNIVDACRLSVKVTCIVESYSGYLPQLIRKLFCDRTSCSVTIESQDELSVPLSDRKFNVRTVVLLAKLSCDQLDNISVIYPDVQSIITIDGFISKNQKMVMKMKNETVTVQILKTDDIFSVSELAENVPKILDTFRLLDSSFRHLPAEDKQVKHEGIYSLPYPVLTFESESGKECIPLQVSKENVFRTNGCYIVVGGLTGLGWELVKCMANLGAKYIATFSRRLPNKDIENKIQEILKTHTCKIIPIQVDVTDLIQLKDNMEKLIKYLGRGVSIRGVLHGAAVTCDKFLKDMSDRDIEKVLLPKVLGTWNLHEVTLNMQLDFFIMHSSVASVFGNQGQCNYAAGNSFQDSFAHYRQSMGLCGQSINWGALSVGMATENETLEKFLNGQGFLHLSKEEIRECFIEAVMTGQSQVIFGKFDWQKMQETPVVTLNPNKFGDILNKHSMLPSKCDVDATVDGMSEFYKEDPVRQKQMIFELVKSKLVKTYVVDEDTLTAGTEIQSLGVDSMAAMSFTNVIFDVTNVRIPIGTLFDESTTVGYLTSFILTRMSNESDVVQTDIQQTDERLKEYLLGDITFMQKSLLDDFVKDPYSRNIMRQVDFEIKGLEIQKCHMKVVFNHLIKINPELRTVYRIEKEGEYQAILLETENVDIDIEDVEFNSICEENTADERHSVKMDLRKDLPIRLLMASRKDATRVRMYLHGVVGDLQSVTNVAIESADIIWRYFQQKELPMKDTHINPAKAVRRAIIPKSNELISYWKTFFQRKIEPFTLSADINEKLEELYWEEFSLQVPCEVVDKMMKIISTEGISVYHFIISTYMVLLHEKTGNYLIPLLTFVDMRIHVQKLQHAVHSCSNAMPVIGDLREMGLLLAYLKRSAHQMNEVLEKSAYPYELIQEEMLSEDLKKHIGRHRFIMENMTGLHNDLRQEGGEIKICKYYYKRHVYETSLHVEYDTQQKIVNLQFGYNGKAIAKENAEQILHRMLQLITTFVLTPHKDVKSLLEANLGVENREFDTCHSLAQDVRFDDIVPKETERLDADREERIPGQSIRPYKTEMTMEKQLHTNCSGVKQEVMYTANFTKQTTHGLEHSVQLKLVSSVDNENFRELLLTWSESTQEITVHGNDILQVKIEEINGMVYVLVETNTRNFKFKSPTLKEATEWVAKFKQAHEDVKH